MHLWCIANSTSYLELTAPLTLQAGQFLVGLQPSLINATPRDFTLSFVFTDW